MNIGKQFLSSLKQHSDYLKWLPAVGRYETWEEAIEDVKRTHMNQALKKARATHPDTDADTQVYDMLNQAFELAKQQRVLPSMRSVQFRDEQIRKHNTKIFNCCTTYCYSPDVFAKGLYVLLCGAGLGVNMHSDYVDQLPDLKKRGDLVREFVIEDSIEGWSDAMNALISSYCAWDAPMPEWQGVQIKYNFSKIRAKGSFINGGFVAPGPEGLQSSLMKIEQLLDRATSNLLMVGSTKFTDIIAYDIFMHGSDAVLSGGVRRSAMLVMFGAHQTEMVNAKTGNWRDVNPQRARSNNSVMVFPDITKETLAELLQINDGTNDLGFVRVEKKSQVVNPCAEIMFDFFEQIKNLNHAVFQFCNLCEINAEKAKTRAQFYEACWAAAVIGTVQASFTSFPYLGQETEEIVAGEALLGVSITGWMNNPSLLNEQTLVEGAAMVTDTNSLVAELIGINRGARRTCVKPSGNSSTVLMTAAGGHCEHSLMFFRLMQLNKEAKVAKWLEQNMSEVLEESQWSATNSDYVVYVPITLPPDAKTKDQITSIEHMEMIRKVQKYWVLPGRSPELCYGAGNHNVSCTVEVEDPLEVLDYLYENFEDFTAVSFLTKSGDRQYVQAPYTSVKTAEKIFELYGPASMFASGLIVDGLHVFSNLWKACDHVVDRGLKFEGTRYELVLQKDWVRRAKKFAKNYFRGNLEEMILCLKDVHLLHKWQTVSRSFKLPDLGTLLDEPEYVSADTLAAAACHGGKCDI